LTKRCWAHARTHNDESAILGSGVGDRSALPRRRRGLKRPGRELIWPDRKQVRRLAAITVRRMGRGTLDRPVRVQRAAEGERFYTWRGRVRQLFPVDGRLVLNAYLGEELGGSAIVSAPEADEDEQRETAWTLADARFSPSGRTSAIRTCLLSLATCTSNRSIRGVTLDAGAWRPP
jgi:hypothetical protein